MTHHFGKDGQMITANGTVLEHWTILRKLWEEADMERIIRESLPDSKEWRLDRLLTSMRVLDEALDDYDSDDDLTIHGAGRTTMCAIRLTISSTQQKISTPQSKG
jgi:hypothetical protein